MDNKILLTVLLGLVTVSAGCLGQAEGLEYDIEPDTEETELNKTAEELLESSIESFNSAETFKVNSTNQLLVTTSWIDIGIGSDSEGVFNRSEKVSEVRSSGETDIRLLTLSNSTGFEAETNVTENDTLVETVSEGEHTETTFETGFDENPFVDFSIVEDRPAEFLGAEKVGETDAYVLSVDTETDDVSEHFSKLLNLHSDSPGNETAEAEEEMDEENIVEFSTYLWIDKDNHRPLKLAYRSTSDIEDDDEGLISFSGLADAYSETEFYGYGEETDIGLE